jgi:hypothetical protein
VCDLDAFPGLCQEREGTVSHSRQSSWSSQANASLMIAMVLDRPADLGGVGEKKL